MAEQISRRAQNVTNSQFEGAFETQTVRFGSGSLNLKDSLDAMEGWARHTNVWHESEGEATARPGQTTLATHGGTTCHSIRKLRDPGSGTATRLWGIDSTVHRGLSGATSSVASGFSGDPLALLPHRPPLSGEPWMFVGDRLKMAKVRADGLTLPIGLPIPGTPDTALAAEYRQGIAMCEAADGTGAASWTPAPGKNAEGDAVGTPLVPTVDIGIAPSGGESIYCVTDPGPAVDDGAAYDSWWGVAVTRDLTVLTEVGGSATVPATDDDLVHISMKTSSPRELAEIRLYLVCSATFDPLILPGTEEGANEDAYVKAFRPNDYVQFVQAAQAQIDAAERARIHALRDRDAQARGVDDVRDSWTAQREASDPARAQSFQIGLGAHQWFSYGLTGSPFRRGDFQRIGSSPGRDWATITGVIVYLRTLPGTGPIAIGVDDIFLTGGFGPDSAQAGAQPYDYRVTHYDPRTGCESNGSEEQAALVALDPLRRGIEVDPPAYGDAAVRQRVYRRGGSLIDDWYYCGENASDGGVFLDDLHDSEIVAAGALPTDHYQPVPTLDPDTGDTILAQPVHALWGPVEGLLFACGDPHRPGHVYYCIGGQPDHWSANGNVEVCAPSEELMNGGVIGHQAFVFSRAKMYFLYPNLTGGAGVTAAPALCTRGLVGRWAYCTGPGGLVFFVAEDGVFATSGGPEEWLSELINPLFYGTTVNGYAPIDKTVTTAIRLTCWENDLFFQYQDTGGVRQVLVFSILQKFWRHYAFNKQPAVLQGEDEDVLLLGGRSTGKSYSHTGPTDDGAAIPCTIRTGSSSGGRREEKLFGDIFLDADLAGASAQLQVYLNEETHTNVPPATLTGSSGRERFLVHAFGELPQKAHSIACELRWASQATVYQLGIAQTLQPELTNSRVTNWDDLNSPDEVWLTGITLDVDTAGMAKEINIERDFNGERILVATFTVVSNNRHKFKFSWPAVPANMVRIRPETGECVAWLLYRADWIYVQEPPRIADWDIHFENQWDQYYTGLDLYCDTGGAEKQIEVWVDEVRLTHPHTSEPFWRVTANGRHTVHLTLPWGRGHVFRFVAIDDNPGLLYTHRWHLQPEPSEQSNWNQNFSILGTRADKWLKAVIFECDTYGADKQVQVEVDGIVVETLTVNTTGRRVVQLALNAQALGRVWRLFPVDANPGRLYSAEPLFDEEPFALDRWETQETNHGLPGWFYPLYGHITLKSSADVTLTTAVQHNQVGGTTMHSYVIPATSNQKQRRFLNGFQAVKGVLIKYVLTSAAPFWLYREESTIVIQPWGAARAITVQPFGSDDLDPTRPMTHAVLAAQASGGAPDAG